MKLMLNMHGVRSSILGFAGAMIVTACTVITARDTVVFSHHLHTEQEISCADCHASVSADAERAVSPMAMENCGDCHDIEDAENCGSCHTNPEKPSTYEERAETHLHFSHQAHGDAAADCASCHRNAAHASSLATGVQMRPGHPECNTCHQKELDVGRCDMCHDRLDVYQRKPQDSFSHEHDFFTKHGLKAVGNEVACATCHDQSFCGDCHNRNQTQRPSVRYPQKVDRNFIHAGDWISRHTAEARIGRSNCLKCHGVSYCNACHERSGRGAHLGLSSPHPGGAVWMASGPQSHGAQARRSILSCASCHDQGASSNCVTCHRSGRVNPHPPGWKAPVPLREREDHPMCGICH